MAVIGKPITLMVKVIKWKPVQMTWHIAGAFLTIQIIMINILPIRVI